MPTSRPACYRYAVPMLALFVLGVSHRANAQSVLYYSDGALNSSGNILPQVLSNLGITPTNATDETDFVSRLGGGGWDLVLFLPQLDVAPNGEAALVNWVNGGGKAIATSTSFNDAFATAFDASYTGQESVVLTSNGSALWNGVSSPITLTNPGYDPISMTGGYGSFSTDLSPQGSGISGGQFFETGDSSIVIGNNGFTILNGFLDDTYDPTTQVDRVTLETNQVRSVLSAGSASVPESGTLAFIFAAALFTLPRLIWRKRSLFPHRL